MRQYYSQEGSQSLPESARQTDCLFSVGPDSGARCRLWSSVASWSGFKKQSRKVSVLLFICLRLPDVTAATGCSSLSSREEAQPALELGCPSPEPQAGSYFRGWPSPSLKDTCVFNSPVLFKDPIAGAGSSAGRDLCRSHHRLPRQRAGHSTGKGRAGPPISGAPWVGENKAVMLKTS